LKRWRATLRAALLTAAGAGSLAAVYAMWVERTSVELDHFTLEIERPGLPARGLTILHLSDFHFHAGGAVQERKLARLRELLATEHYDVVALTGDLIHDIAGMPPALALIESLRPRQAEQAMYFCPGNHDYAEYTPFGVFGHTWRESTEGRLSLHDAGRAVKAIGAFVRKVVRNELVRMPVAFNDVPAIMRRLEAVGVTTLVNTCTPFRLDGCEVWFGGVDDEMESTPDLAGALEGIPAGAPAVLLAHNPDIWLQCGVDRFDLVLSGHTHGGQIQLPAMGAIHTQGTHLRRSRPAGWFERGRSKMFVSRGLGESIPLRFRAGPQVAMITLVSKQESGFAPEGSEKVTAG
jgi:uncharacterized protein